MKEKQNNLTEVLPDPTGPLSIVVPTSSISDANQEVSMIYKEIASGERRKGPYVKLTDPSQRCEIGRRAAQYGTTNAIRYYKKKYPDLNLSESTIRRLKNSYKDQLRKRPLEEKSSLAQLPMQKRGRPLMIGEKLEGQVKHYLMEIRKRGGVVNAAIALAVGKGIVRNGDLPYKDVELTKDWAKYLLSRMGLVKRKASTSAKVSVENFERKRELFLHEVKLVMEMEDIPAELVINFDQTGIKYVPTSSWTLEKEGSKRVAIVGKDDKRQITAVIGCSMSGDVLPFQLIYEGKTSRCLPSYNFPRGFDITCNPTHWSNEMTMLRYLDKVIFPYVAQKREDLGMSADFPALLLFDNFSGQCTPEVLKMIYTHHMHVVLIPPNCTDRLQPLDLSVNKSVKDFLKRQFQEWYVDLVSAQVQKCQVELIDLRLSIVKSLGAKWMNKLYDYLRSKPEIVCNGFRAAGIL